MGACISKHDNQSQNASMLPIVQQIPEFYYLSRLSKEILHIKPQAITKYSLGKKLKIYEDSAIGYLSDNKIMVIGGSDKTGCLVNNAYIIDLASKQASVISKLPLGSKGGHIFQYNKYVYYIDGLIEGENEDSNLMVEPAPLMRYSTDDNCWEYYVSHKHAVKKEIKTFLTKRVTERHDDYETKRSHIREISYTDLINSGIFLYNGKIYFIGGQRINTIGKLKSTKKIYSLDCDSLEFKLEPCRMPIKILNPLCAVRSNNVVIAGGINPIDNKPNYQAYTLVFSEKMEFKRLESIKDPISEKYPPLTTKEASLFFSYPKVHYIDNGLLKWSQKDIDEISSKAIINPDKKIEISENKVEEKNPVKYHHKISTALPLEEHNSFDKEEGSPSSSEYNEEPLIEPIESHRIQTENPKATHDRFIEKSNFVYEEIGPGGLKRLIRGMTFDVDEFKRRLTIIEEEKMKKKDMATHKNTGFKDWIIGEKIEGEEQPEVRKRNEEIKVVRDRA
ncbi:unnamed protein product [Blepharisma stoltei]|uniref:Uncharacterized protein n=1 Tax=Blepharisma stoltei TaxID=1481888 RepID=A0AAU9IUP8_9CILI|nr:unnamed protein product [Blepharisma stoltei]